MASSSPSPVFVAANVAVSSVEMTPLLALSSSSSVRDANCKGSDMLFSLVSKKKRAVEKEKQVRNSEEKSGCRQSVSSLSFSLLLPADAAAAKGPRESSSDSSLGLPTPPASVGEPPRGPRAIQGRRKRPLARPRARRRSAISGENNSGSGEQRRHSRRLSDGL